MTVVLVPAAAAQVARALREAADEVADEAAALRALPSASGDWLGACEEGRGWGRLLDAQTAALASLLDHHVDVLRATADQVVSDAAAFREVDARLAAALVDPT